MIRGLRQFQDHFRLFADRYVLIGGTACTLLMEEIGLSFRVTKDFDIVLYVEALDAQFVSAFWDFVQSGGYENRQRSSGKDIFYRFSSPKNKEYPSMLELFSRQPDTIQLRGGGQLTPIPVNEAIVSLSAILLDDDYYRFIHQGKVMIADLPVVAATHLIPLKAQAWIDLKHRKHIGQAIDERDIRKHKNDVWRLYQLLTPTTAPIAAPDSVRLSMRLFLDEMVSENSFDPKSLGLQRFDLPSAIQQLREIYS